MKKTKLLTYLTLGTALAACGREPIVPPPPPTNAVADVLEAQGLTTLLTALETAGLTETLAGEGPFTVFAPTNDAFDALPEGMLDSLLADPTTLGEVLQYHVVGETLGADAITGAGDSFQSTLSGAPVGVTVSEENEVVLNATATVTETDLEADNGVVHTIDSVLLPPASEFSVELSPDNEVIPPDAEYDEIVSDATGSATATLNLDADAPSLSVTGEFSGLSSPLLPVGDTPAHLHGPAAEDENAGILFPLSVSGEGQAEPATLSGEFDLTPETFGYVVSGLTYVNIHTETYPAGELRGQLIPVMETPAETTSFVAALSPDEEVVTDDLPYDSVESDAFGTVTFTFDPEALTLSADGTFEGLTSAPLPIGEGDDATPVHIHEAPAGENGPIAFPLTLTSAEADPAVGTITGEVTLTEEQVETLLAEGYYVNLHSETYPGGELRGQIVPATDEDDGTPEEGL